MKLIKFYGFGWDYGGTVKLGNGKINKTGLSLMLTAPMEHPEYNNLLGDKIFTSKDLSDELKNKITVGEIKIWGLTDGKLSDWCNSNHELPKNCQPQKIDDETLSALPIKGEIIQALQWGDRAGLHIMVLSQKNSVEEVDEGPAPGTKTLYAQKFDKNIPYEDYDNEEKADTNYNETYTLKETETKCYFQMDASFAKDGIILTDMDNNDDMEVSFAYQMGCTSELTDKPIKMITLSGEEEYIIYGTTTVDYGHEIMVGETNFSASFNNAPLGFLASLKPYWKNTSKITTKNFNKNYFLFS